MCIYHPTDKSKMASWCWIHVEAQRDRILNERDSIQFLGAPMFPEGNDYSARLIQLGAHGSLEREGE